MAAIQNVEYWDKRWKEGDNPWHKTFIQPCLEKYYQKLIPSCGKSSKTRVFLPLCGKSLDILWLVEKGFQVIGLEGVESAVQSFFEEHNIAFEVKTTPGEIKYYCATEKDIKIYVMDLMEASRDTFGELFDAIWDRGSISAIGVHAENRGRRYADLMTSLLHPNGCIMVESHVYIEDPGPHREPPSHITLENLQEFFGDKFDIEKLDCEMPVTSFRREYHLMSLKN